MSAVNYGYVRSELKRVESELEQLESGPGAGAQPPMQPWRYMHWGYFADPDVRDDSPERARQAFEALTEHILAAADVGDGESVVDVGCGFGGTLDHIRTRHSGCRLVGVNIDFRQVHSADRLLTAYGEPTSDPVGFIAADGCRLPLPDGAFQRVLAIECIFHFPSRKAFFAEAARVLRPGGTLTLSDFVIAPGALPTVWTTMAPVWGDTGGSEAEGSDSANGSKNSGLGSPGQFARSTTYGLLSRRAGFEIVEDEDITAQTVPTYAFLRRVNRETRGEIDPGYAEKDLMNINGLEALSMQGDLQYRVVTFRKP